MGAHLLPLARNDLWLARSDGFGGIRPVDWPEILGFCWTMQLSPWEGRMLMVMSRAYVQGFVAGQNVFSRPPTEWGDL